MVSHTPPPIHTPAHTHVVHCSGFGLALRVVVSNLWLFGGLFTQRLASDPTTAPMVRTTTAVTVVSGGLADNVMPTTATALVNHRIHPLDTVASVLAHDKRVRCARLNAVATRAARQFAMPRHTVHLT